MCDYDEPKLQLAGQLCKEIMKSLRVMQVEVAARLICQQQRRLRSQCTGNSGTLLFILECQARFAAGCIAALAKAGGATIEVERSAFDRYNRWVQDRLEKSVYKATRNYYAAASGRIVTQWPFSATRFWWMTRTRRRSAMKIG